MRIVLVTVTAVILSLGINSSGACKNGQADNKSANIGSAQDNQTPSTATSANLTGTYESPGGDSLSVLQLPDAKIKFRLLAIWPKEPYASKKEYGPHIGDAEATLSIEKNLAVYKEDDSDATITFEFFPHKVIVKQEGTMKGFGANVTADGTYWKKSNKRPPDLSGR